MKPPLPEDFIQAQKYIVYILKVSVHNLARHCDGSFVHVKGSRKEGIAYDTAVGGKAAHDRLSQVDEMTMTNVNDDRACNPTMVWPI